VATETPNARRTDGAGEKWRLQRTKREERFERRTPGAFSPGPEQRQALLVKHLSPEL